MRAAKPAYLNERGNSTATRNGGAARARNGARLHRRQRLHRVSGSGEEGSLRETEAKLKRDHVDNKEDANATHYWVGELVRNAIKIMGGTMPEDLPTNEDIKAVKRRRQHELKHGAPLLPMTESEAEGTDEAETGES
jgi:hypothetical protein